jgi:hypothetical protein
MAARKTSRTTKPQPSRARSSDTPSRVRNSQIVGRRDRPALENEPASTSEPFEVASTSEPFGAAVDDDDIERALELERPPPLPRQVSNSGTLATLGDNDAAGLVDSGMPIEPEEMAAQFLRDATEQGNFESQLPRDDRDNGVVILPHVVISDATLDTSMQVDAEWLEGNAVQNTAAEGPAEPFERNVDLTQDTIAAASLFDQVVPDEALNDDELDDVPVEGVTMEPTLHTEDPSDPSTFEEAREREMRRVRREMLKKRQQSEGATTTARNGK